jgi:Ca2+-binding RTX toxin-like protein
LTWSQEARAVTFSDCGNGNGTVTIANPANADGLQTVNGVTLCTASGSDVECSVNNTSVCPSEYPTELFFVTNTSTTAVTDDWVFWGRCGLNGGIDFCVVIDDDAESVHRVGMRGTSATATGTGGVDFMYFSYPATSPTVHLIEDSGMYNELEAAMWGESGADWLMGSQNKLVNKSIQREHLYGGDGDDDIRNIEGVHVNIIFGGKGTDFIDAGRQNDEVHGGDGWDIIVAGYGSDSVWGGDGPDVICGSSGTYTTGNPPSTWANPPYMQPSSYTGACDNTNNNDGVDVIFGEDGNDTIYGGKGNDWLYGGADVQGGFLGSADSDSLYGGGGGDFLWGAGGTDTLSGEGEDDILCDFDGDANTITGGAGDDTIWLEDEDPNNPANGTVDAGEDTNGMDVDQCGVDMDAASLTTCETVLPPPAPPSDLFSVCLPDTHP